MNATTCLDRQQIELLLTNDLSPTETADVEQHLSECKRCRSAIEGQIGEASWWDEATVSLAASESTKVDREHFDDHERDDEDLESLVGMLGPTDHPEMLGRIGHYEVAGVLGRGGMGAVFKAFDHSLNRFVAIKVMLPHLAASGAARKRFAREAQAAAAVVDDHVMAIHSVSEWKSMPYIVMPYTRGISLQKRLQDQGPLELREILRIAMQSARGLAAAHAQGLVHRDIKPANIFLQDNVERVQLMDFGLARAANDNAGLTRTGMLAGTPQYMSPEQVRAEAVDGRSDLYGLGAVMYAICTGYPPYRAESSYAVLRMITDQSPRAIRELNPDIPEWLCAIISKLMAKQSKERFASAAEVANLLEACLAHVQEPTRSPLPAAVEALVPKPRPSRRGFWTGAAIAASMLGMLGLVTAGGVMLVLRLNQGELTIESEVSDIPIRVRQGDHVVDRMTINRDGKSLRVAAGEYIVEVEGKFDDLMIENSQVTLARGGTAVVKIKEQPAEHGDHAHSHGDDHAPSQWTPLVESPAVRPQEIPLGNLVDQYNASSNKVDDFALTEDEVKAYCRWQLTHNPDLKTDTERFYERIATDGQVAKGWSISTVRHWIWSEADKILAGYQIIFAFTGNGENSVGEWNLPPIRQRHFAPAIGYLKPTQVGDPGSIPLSAVLKQFNKQHVEVAGRKQPELNEQEVLAAIFAWKDRRKEANVDDVTFEKFQEILKTHYLPQGAELELVHKFTGAPDETIYKATAQIKLPLHNNPKRSYAFVIRELFIEAVRGESSQVPVFVGDSTKSDSHGSSVTSEIQRRVLKYRVEMYNNWFGRFAEDLPPLTEEEVLAFCVWNLKTNSQLTPDQKVFLQHIVAEREFRTSSLAIYQFVGAYRPSNTFRDPNDSRYSTSRKRTPGPHSYVISLRSMIPIVKSPSNVGEFRIRHRYLAPRDEFTKPTQPADEGAIPLDAAIKEFNQSHSMVNDRKQDPISLNEVLGAIDAWEARRAEASVDDETFNKFQKIKKTHYLPADARIEVISNFDNGDGDTCYIWSVRIGLPIASQPERTYAFVIREQYVGVSSINSGKIAWGKPLENGIQAGFRLIPDQHEFLPGQQVRVEVFYRSVFGQEREGTLPNHFTIGEANVSDSEGNTVETETVRKELIIGGAQSAMISEEPLVVNSATLLQFGVDSHGEHAAHEQDHQATHAIVIKAKPGQKLRLSLKVTDLLTGDGSLAQTGDMEIQVAK